MFIRKLSDHDAQNEIFKDQYGGYTWEGAGIIVEIESELNQDEDVELDLAAIRGVYSEYTSLTEALKDLEGMTLTDYPTKIGHNEKAGKILNEQGYSFYEGKSCAIVSQ